MSPRLGAAVAAALLVAGCGSGDADPRASLSVYAASSLTEAFGDLEVLFEQGNPGADVAVTFAGSQVLRIQIEEGAPADVYASADPAHVRALVDAGLLSGAERFARNDLVVIVPLDNPAGIESLTDLPRARRLVWGTPEAPVGRYARRALALADSLLGSGFANDVRARVVSEEPNVRLARSKVELSEADAAIVYRTDAVGSDRVRVVEIPPAVNVRAEYLMGMVERVGRSSLAEAWIATVRSPAGRAVLEGHGFVVE